MLQNSRFRVSVLCGVLAVLSLVATAPTRAPARPEEPQILPKAITNSIGMKLVRIPQGKFKMGSPLTEDERNKNELQHEVEITHAFWMGVHEVTQQQFKEVMGYNPSYFSKEGNGKKGTRDGDTPAGGKRKVPTDTSSFPVDNVSWQEAVDFCKKLSAGPKERGRRYRLPTEAEWEYACRGNPAAYQVFHFGNSLSAKQANFDGYSPYGSSDARAGLERTCKVGSYEKNAFGLYDLHGNVWEWCSDRYDEDYYRTSPKKHPKGPAEGKLRVLRGGAWNLSGWHCRSAYRCGGDTKEGSNLLGFRVVLVPAEK